MNSIHNQTRSFRQPLDSEDILLFDALAAEKAIGFWSKQERYNRTPLYSLPGLANQLGIEDIYIKDEGTRLGLQSFKGLGGAYAVISLALEEASRQLGYTVKWEDLNLPAVKKITNTLTFACATDGNHGRSVAYGSQLAGARSIIFVHERVSQKRRDAIARYGAQLIEVKGTYDDSVLEASRVSEKNNWILTSDTSWPGYERIPGLVMQGYLTLVAESIHQFRKTPTHVLVQAGVGGLAASVAAHLKITLKEKCPAIIVVEPERAACLFESALADAPTKIAHGQPTVMSMLECYDPSMMAWRILSRTADAFVTVPDAGAVETMNLLAHPVNGDPVIVSGESGGAGLAALLPIRENSSYRDSLGINEKSIVFLINTEGATDPERYEQLVGKKPDQVI